MSENYWIPIIEEMIRKALPKAVNIEIGGASVIFGYGCFEIEYFNLTDYEVLNQVGVRDFSISNAATNPKNLFVEFRFGEKFPHSKTKVEDKT